MKEIKQIIEAFEQARMGGWKTALATVVHVEGSSYRAPGARMLIREDGLLTSAISGGCLEGDALRKALMVIMQGRPLLVTYNTTDGADEAIGIHLGCNGVIRVLIEPIDPETSIHPIMLLKKAVEQKEEVVLVTLFSLENYRDTRQGTRLLVKKGDVLNETAFHLTCKSDHQRLSCFESRMLKDIKKVFEVAQSLFITYQGADQQGTAKEMSATDYQSDPMSDPITAFLEYVKPAISLVIAGAGNDVIPVVQMAGWMGWETTLIDGRPNYAHAGRFSGCQIIVAAPESAYLDEVVGSRSACLLMSHNYDYDKAMLRRLSEYPVTYIGMLGPRKKFERIMRELKAEGVSFSDEQLSGLYGPVGLDIGAETAEEIACSVIAEINMAFSTGTGKPLSTLPGSIHHRDTDILNTVQGISK
jgi:xanthine/CO dehydrogenase XdhC/CoxF family maturation factor